MISTDGVVANHIAVLMFVFWYCHKRGKETRLAREAEGEEKSAEGGEDVGLSDSAENSEVEEMVEELEKADSNEQRPGQDQKADILNQPAPSEVPLPETKEGSKAGDATAMA